MSARPPIAASSPKDKASATKTLLSRAHDPTAATRLFNDKIQHRPFLLRPSSPPPGANARAQRRHARRKKLQDRKRTKPKPITARDRRTMGLYHLPPQGLQYKLYEPLHRLWLGYIHEILGKEVFTGGPAVAAKLAGADFHGAEIEVCRSGCVGRVGLKGIVIKDAKHVFEIITSKNKMKTVPKEGTTFRVEIPSLESWDAARETATKAGAGDKASTQDNSIKGATGQEDGGGNGGEGSARAQAGEKEEGKLAGGKHQRKLVVEIVGDQFQARSSERANKKFKSHFLKNL